MSATNITDSFIKISTLSQNIRAISNFLLIFQKSKTLFPLSLGCSRLQIVSLHFNLKLTYDRFRQKLLRQYLCHSH